MGHSIESALTLLITMGLTYKQYQVTLHSVRYENVISTFAYIGLTMIQQD